MPRSYVSWHHGVRTLQCLTAVILLLAAEAAAEDIGIAKLIILLSSPAALTQPLMSALIIICRNICGRRMISVLSLTVRCSLTLVCQLNQPQMSSARLMGPPSRSLQLKQV